MHWSVIWSQWNSFVRDKRSNMSKFKWCSAIKLKCFSNFLWWFQPNHDVPKKHHEFTELDFSPGKAGTNIILRACSFSRIPRDLRGVVKWRKQCPGSKIPPGLALAEAEQVHFKLSDFLVDLHCPLRVKLEECSAALSSDLELFLPSRHRDRSVFFTSLWVLQDIYRGLYCLFPS